MINSPRPLFLLHQTIQLALCIQVGRVLLASTKPRWIHWTGEAWFTTAENTLPLLQSPPLPPTLGIAHSDLRLVCGCLAMETHFMMLPINIYCAVFVWKLVLSVATKDRQFLRATRFSTRRSRSVSLCDLPLCGWAVVAPVHFHFTITALAVDRGSSSRTDILINWLVGKVASYDGAMLKATEFFSFLFIVLFHLYLTR